MNVYAIDEAMLDLVCPCGVQAWTRPFKRKPFHTWMSLQCDRCGRFHMTDQPAPPSPPIPQKHRIRI